MNFVFDDGGRRATSLKGKPRDCVCRAIAIATQRPYEEVYAAITEVAQTERRSKRRRHRSHPDRGVFRTTYQKYIESLGWEWVPTMRVGAGCRVHLRREELPPGRLIVRVSGHLVAVINGTIHDTHDCTRDGNRCVYGYFREPESFPDAPSPA